MVRNIFPRIADFTGLLKTNSHFIFGPRATGKSFWLRYSLKDVPLFDLLNSDTYARFLRRPAQLGEEIPPGRQTAIIDEIQRLPALLNEVHRLTEERGMRFLLTGSSTRRLKTAGVNLLAGRAWEYHFYPLVSAELPDFRLTEYLNKGGLPRVWKTPEWKKELKNYVGLYILEEVKSEASVRKMDNFARFLDMLGLQNGKELHYRNISSDCGVPVRTVESYLRVLEEMLIGFELLPFLKTKTRKAVTRSKFYFFDVGVANELARKGEILEGSALFGDGFEHWLILEIRAHNGLSGANRELFYWRSTGGAEVDLVIGDRAAIEFKAVKQVLPGHLKNLKLLREEGLLKDYIIVSLDPVFRVMDGIKIYPCAQFLKELWRGEVI